ncbi:MAG: serine/threonine-protein phosphatase, partial [Gammaproteobacteria bacterium]|nr:serine/threonine-protein phosphatase [Gammaproteobacteria bacterium]
NVHERLGEDHFMTFTALKYLGEGRFQYAGAHLDLVVYRRQRQVCELIETPGVWLNLVPDIAYETENSELTLGIGDVLVLYTDGLTEVWDSERKMLDMHGFIDIVQTHAEKEIDALRDAIITDVMAWCNHIRDDDMSLVVVRRRG